MTLFDDTYTGKRYTYGLTYRPLGFANVPDGWIIFSNKPHPNYTFGTVDYPLSLEKVVQEQYQLEEV